MAESNQQLLIPGGWMIEIQNLVTALNQQQQDLIQQQQDFIQQQQDLIHRQQQRIRRENKTLISEEWSEEVKKFLVHAVPADRASVRLSKALINVKGETYTPQMVSLGPYHHFSLKDKSVGPFHQRLTHLSQMEEYKLRSACEAAGNDPALVKKMFVRVNQPDMISEFEHFYNWKIEEDDSPKYAWMMLIDALFLFYFLTSGFDNIREEFSLRSGASNDIIVPAKASIRCDIVKLENQIPLSLLKQLEVIAQETETLESLLPYQMSHLSSFQVSNIEMPDFNEKHLLGYIHKYVSSFVQVTMATESPPTWCQRVLNVMGDIAAVVFSCCYRHPAKRGRQDFLDKYNAKELLKAGIKFKSFEGPGKIRFSKTSDTLYLPRIIIFDTYTEVLLRNLLALEFNDAGREKHVTNYLKLMDCLIDSPEDVRLLRESHVIDRQRMKITDDYVAKMWYGMSRPLFLAGFIELPGDLKAQIKEAVIKNYYKSKIKTQLLEYLSNPWKMVAMLVGIFVLLLHVLQTYCSVYNCEAEHSPTVNASNHFRPFG